MPDDDAATDEHDQRVDREPEGVPPAWRRALEDEQGDDDHRVVGDVRDVGQGRGGRAAGDKAHPGPCAVAHGVDECRDAHHGPAKANPPNIDAQRGPQDEYGREQVQGGFADQGAGQPCIRVPDAGDEPGDRDAPAADREGKKDSVERDSTATSPLRVGTGSVRWHCPFWRTDRPAGVDDVGGDHARYRDLEAWSSTGDREDPSTVFVPQEPEQAP